MKKVKFLAMFLVLALTVSMFAGCSSTGSSKDQNQSATSSAQGSGNAGSTDSALPAGHADYMSYAIWNQSFDLKPFASSAGGRGQLLQMIWPRLCVLTSYGGKLEDAEMWLAKKITKVDDVTYDVELYDNIIDSKGYQIKAEDVKWSYEMATTLGEQTEVGGVLGGIEILDDYNLRFTLNSPGEGKAEVMLGFHRMTICSKEWYENATDEERSVDAATAAPYRIKEYIPGSMVVLEAVENYWQKDESLRGVAGQQNVKTVYCPVITEKAVRAISLQNGEIDWTTIDVSSLDMFFQNGQALDGWNVDALGGERARVLFLNMDESSTSPVATNVKLRQAVLHALDRDALRRAAGFSEYTAWVCYDIGTTKMAGYNEAWQNDWYEYDPDLAKQLLAEAGYPNGVTLRLMAATSQNAGMIAYLQESLEQIGIHVELLSYDQALFNTYKYDSSVWDIIVDQKGGYSLIDDWYNLFNPGGYTNGGVNFCKDQQLYDLINTVMLDASQENIDAVHERLKDLALGTGLYCEARINVSQGGITKTVWNNYNEPLMNAWEFSPDFKSNYPLR